MTRPAWVLPRLVFPVSRLREAKHVRHISRSATFHRRDGTIASYGYPPCSSRQSEQPSCRCVGGPTQQTFLKFDWNWTAEGWGKLLHTTALFCCGLSKLGAPTPSSARVFDLKSGVREAAVARVWPPLLLDCTYIYSSLRCSCMQSMHASPVLGLKNRKARVREDVSHDDVMMSWAG